ncbi:MAG: hypothetical protein ACRBI6_14360 [Acidimicrobiales bacterium]
MPVNHPLRRHAHRVAGLALSFALVATACGDGTSDAGSDLAVEVTTTEGDTTTTGVTTTQRSLPDRATSPDPTAPTTTEAGETTTEPTSDPGSPIDFGPSPGTPIAVVGVRWDDTLNFRSGPGVETDVVIDLPAIQDFPTPIVASGEAWQFPGSIWWKVEVDGQELWASQSFLGMLGNTTDITAEVEGLLGIQPITTIEDAADRVAATRLIDVESEIRIRHVVQPLAFDFTSRAVIDVLGYPDDSVKGERLEITLDPVFDESGDEPELVGWVVTRVDSTPICSRGVSGGLCL